MAKLGNNSDIAYQFIERLDDIYDSCGYIQEFGACDKCPLMTNCIEDTSVAEFQNFCTPSVLKEFLDFAQDIENHADEQDFHDWMESQKERELWED